MESVEASKGPERETGRPGARRRTGPVMQRREREGERRERRVEKDRENNRGTNEYDELRLGVNLGLMAA